MIELENTNIIIIYFMLIDKSDLLKLEDFIDYFEKDVLYFTSVIYAFFHPMYEKDYDRLNNVGIFIQKLYNKYHWVIEPNRNKCYEITKDSFGYDIIKGDVEFYLHIGSHSIYLGIKKNPEFDKRTSQYPDAYCDRFFHNEDEWLSFLKKLYKVVS